jgi:peroxiredoxin
VPLLQPTLRALQVELGAIQAHGAKRIALSPQAPDHALTLTEKHELEFSVLSDASQATIAAYRLRYVVPAALQDLYLKFGNDLREQNADGSWNLPVPATFVIDRGGTISARFVDMDFTKRMEPADVVSALAEINGSDR